MVIMGFAACSHRTTLPDPQQAGWEGKSVCEVVQENDKLRVLRCTFPPGVGHERHFHAPHIGYTIAGSTFRIEDASGVREVNVPTGSSFDNAYIPLASGAEHRRQHSGVPHYRNERLRA